MIEMLKQDPLMSPDRDCMTALNEMETLLKYCQLYKVQDKVINTVIISSGLLSPVNMYEKITLCKYRTNLISLKLHGVLS